MKIKTSELSEMTLCYVVCMIEMPHLVWGDTIGEHHASKQIVVPELREPDCYSPYMNWAMFGPIIERELIRVIAPKVRGVYWVARIKQPLLSNMNGWVEKTGPTPLVAAMRCYVASKLGDEIEIPEELK